MCFPASRKLAFLLLVLAPPRYIHRESSISAIGGPYYSFFIRGSRAAACASHFLNSIRILSDMCTNNLLVRTILMKEMEDEQTVAIIGSTEPFLCDTISKFTDESKKLFVSWNCPQVIRGSLEVHLGEGLYHHVRYSISIPSK